MHIDNWIILTTVQVFIALLTGIGVLVWLRLGGKKHLLEAQEEIDALTQASEKHKTKLTELTAAGKDAKKNANKLNKEIKTLTAALAASEEADKNTGEAPTQTDETDQPTQSPPPQDAAADEVAELKKLLQQFTLESRDMLNCIDELQRENTQLKAAVGAEIDPSLPEPLQETIDDAVEPAKDSDPGATSTPDLSQGAA